MQAPNFVSGYANTVKRPLTYVRSRLDAITSYRLIVYLLGLLFIVALLFSLAGLLGFSVVSIALEFALLLAASFVADLGWRWLFKAPANAESWLITALILGFILPPVTSSYGVAVTIAAAVLAASLKYLVAYRHRHIFNPAALTVVVLGLTGLVRPLWWVGSSALFIPVVILGILLTVKHRHYGLIGTMLAVGLIAGLTAQPQAGLSGLTGIFVSGPFLFLTFVMLSEPQTMPPRRLGQMVYALIVGLLYVTSLRVGTIAVTPEIALVLGNLFAFTIATNYKRSVVLQTVRMHAENVREYVFSSPSPIKYRAGQYAEWTLGSVGFDSRGNRRTFSLTSPPSGSDVSFAVKFYPEGSQYKDRLKTLEPGAKITLGAIGGSFVLPRQSAKVVMIAGGIGVTPFVSMIQTLLDVNPTADVTLVYMVGREEEYVFAELWDRARQAGFKIYPLLAGTPSFSWHGGTGPATPELLLSYIGEKNLSDVRVYISGPPPMVRAYKQTVRGIGVTRRHIVTDYFSGY
jgi:ferredoxin-NADP reductase/Na+-translocating ferredoxin:NAD+ oxidoreductase RnfD subunit